MSYYQPPRDPRNRYPALDRYGSRRQAQQPLTPPLITSGWYTGRQSVAKTDSVAGDVPTAAPMPNKDRRRMIDGKGHSPSQSGHEARSKDQYYDQDCSGHRKVIRDPPSRSEGDKHHRKDTDVARCRKEPFAKNGTANTSSQCDIYSSPYKIAEDLLSAQYRNPGPAAGEWGACGSEDQCAKLKSRQEAIHFKRAQRPSENYLPISPSGKGGREIGSDAIRPALSSPPVTNSYSHRQRDTYRPRREVERKESSKQELISVGAVEEEITCPICMTILVGAMAAVPCGHFFCAPCGLSWIRDHDNCPICRDPLARPLTIALVPMRVVDALVEKWVEAKGSRWEGRDDWRERRAAWDAQRVVWREDLEAVNMSRETRQTRADYGGQLGGDAERSVQDDGADTLPMSPITSWNPLAVSGFDEPPHHLFQPDPISAFLDRMASHRAIEDLLRNMGTRLGGSLWIDTSEFLPFPRYRFDRFSTSTSRDRASQRQGAQRQRSSWRDCWEDLEQDVAAMLTSLRT